MKLSKGAATCKTSNDKKLWVLKACMGLRMEAVKARKK